MSRLVKIVDNKYVQIEEYKNPNICFNTNEYDNSENYCTLRETFNPFKMFYENQELKEVIGKLKEYISSQMIAYDDCEDCGVDCECDGFKLLDILKEVE